MANDKKSFIVYKSWRTAFELLTDSEKSQFMLNLFKFHNDEEIILDTPMLEMFWKSIEYNLYDNDRRYQTSKENGAKGGAPKGNKNASKQPKTTEEQPKQSLVEQNKLNVNVNDNVNHNVNNNGKVNDNINDNVKAKLFTVYNAEPLIEIENTDVDYMIDESDYEITRPMLERIIDKFIAVDSRFKFQSVIREIDEDYGGFDNLIQLYLPTDTSAQKNFKNQLNQYKNGIFA